MAEERRSPVPAFVKVEVAYALADEQVLLALEVESGTTVGEAIERSGIRARFPGLRIVQGGVGLFGKPVELDETLRDGDRVEIYRPLVADPKDARRSRARQRKPAPRR